LRRFLIAGFIIVLLLVTLIVGISVGFMVSGDGFGVGGERVAVLRIEDIILDSQIYIESISSIKKDKSIKAVVLRIDSPGGAVGPSQEIYSEVKLLREKLPVVASIGTVGASGGYYIACAAEKIVANPGAITGSIGVIAQFVNYEQLLSWAKLNVEVIKSGEFKDVGSPLRQMTESERKYFQELIDNVHSQFKLAVSEGRGIGSKQMDQIADGRIFTGEQAKNLKLVDELGSVSDAIRLAGTMSGIGKEPEVVYYPKSKSRFLDLLLSGAKTHALSGFPVKERFGLFYLVDIIR